MLEDEEGDLAELTEVAANDLLALGVGSGGSSADGGGGGAKQAGKGRQREGSVGRQGEQWSGSHGSGYSSESESEADAGAPVAWKLLVACAVFAALAMGLPATQAAGVVWSAVAQTACLLASGQTSAWAATFEQPPSLC
jgi:hypothetical protein